MGVNTERYQKNQAETRDLPKMLKENLQDILTKHNYSRMEEGCNLQLIKEG